jgi:glycosyltransferase involved in cell wall biosynthesis
MSAYFIIPDFFDTRMDKSTYVEMIYELNKLGLDIKVLTSYSKDMYINNEKNFSPVYFSTVKIPLILRVILILKMFFYLIRVAKKNDVIIVSPESLGVFYILKLIKKIKLHLDIRTFPVVLSNSIKEKFDHFLSFKFSLKYFFKHADSHSFITEFMKDEINRIYGLSPKSYCLWSSGVSLESFRYDEIEERKGSEVIFFYHGTVTETRGLGLMYEAFKSLVTKVKDDLKLVIVGDGSYLSTLKELIVEDKLVQKVQIHGYVAYEKILGYIKKADICLCPLPNRVEWNVSSPIKVFEYMALGKPILCTNIPAHVSVLKDQPFVIFTEDNVKSMTEAMETALNSLGTLKGFSDMERKYVERYTWKKQAENFFLYLTKQMG